MKYIRIKQHGVIFIRIPKVASSSIKAAVLGRKLPADEGEDSTSGNVRKIFPEDFIFTSVRNPWDRLVSCYVDKVIMRDAVPHTFPQSVKKGMSFGEFVRIVSDTPDIRSDTHFRSQASYFCPEGTLGVNCLIRFENIHRDWDVVRGILGSRGIVVTSTLPHFQRRDRDHYSTYYTSDLVDLVAERYRREIKLLGYEFEPH